jgi:hypothetical protein
MLTVRVPLTVWKRGGRKLVVVPAVHVLHAPARMDVTLVKAVARAFRWRRLLNEGRFNSLEELAAKEKISPSYVSRVLRLTLLAPDLVEAILDGQQPEGMTLPGLLEPFLDEWEKRVFDHPLGDGSAQRPAGPAY